MSTNPLLLRYNSKCLLTENEKVIFIIKIIFIYYYLMLFIFNFSNNCSKCLLFDSIYGLSDYGLSHSFKDPKARSLRMVTSNKDALA